MSPCIECITARALGSNCYLIQGGHPSGARGTAGRKAPEGFLIDNSYLCKGFMDGLTDDDLLRALSRALFVLQLQGLCIAHGDALRLAGPFSVEQSSGGAVFSSMVLC